MSDDEKNTANETFVEPRLLPALSHPVAALAVIGLVAAACCLGMPDAMVRSGIPTRAVPVLMMAGDQAAGAIVAIDLDFNHRPELLRRLAMPDLERDRLRAAVTAGQVRIGMIRVWDSADEDGDRIRIDGVGFSQNVTILHKPQTFLVPYRPGGAVTITAIHDGGGGGVTLGVASVLGPTPLPPLAVGQALEIPVL